MTVEPELIERLVADAASEPGILPLLQEALVQLWDARADQTLTLADYQALGDGVRSGLAVALARRADATLQRFNTAQTDIARRILLRLISFGEGRSDTRRQQPRTRLRTTGEDAADFEFVLRTMVDHRLLTVDEDVDGEPRVDLAHEIMISAWPALAGWIRGHRVDEQRRRQLEATAARWGEHGRGIRGLLDPIELAEAELWQQSESAVQLGQSAAVKELVVASRAAQSKQRRRRRVIVTAVGILGLVAAVIAAVALTERGQANEARRLENEARRSAGEARRLENEARRLAKRNQELVAQSYEEAGRQFLVDGRYQEAVPYLLAARQSGTVSASAPLGTMFWEAEQYLPLISLEHRGAVLSAVFSLDGTRVVTASEDETARVWDAATGKPLTDPLVHHDQVVSAAFSRDGRHVVTASWDQTAQVWDATTGRPIIVPLAHQGRVVSVALSPDGERVVTASDDKTAQVWNAATGQLITRLLEHRATVCSAAFSPDGKRVVTASHDKTARVWDAATGKPLTGPLEHRGWVWSAAFSPEGTRVVTASYDKTARVWDAATGKPLTRSLAHRDCVGSAGFSRDGMRVVTASWDRTARVWDVGFDTGTLEQWRAIAERSPFVLSGAALVRRSPPGRAGG
ncbi:MAG TPA: WD40 repeat domain-containing protein [Gemmatimonadaceae bacterium]